MYISILKKTSPPHFTSRIPIDYKGFREGGVCQTGHSTPHLTPPSFYFCMVILR